MPARTIAARLLALIVATAALTGASVIAQPSSDCANPDARALLDRAAALLRAWDDEGARAALAAGGAHGCAEVAVAQLAVTGWVEARALAPKGGDTTLLGPVNAVLRALDGMRRSSAARGPVPGGTATLGIQIDYADAAIRAAVGAAQEERAEMAVYLEHARDLAETLGGAGDSPIWPLPYDELAGELWLEVDRYADARAAFTRAAARVATARSLAGLALAADRDGDTKAACDAYRRALKMNLAAGVRSAAEGSVAKCPS